MIRSAVVTLTLLLASSVGVAQAFETMGARWSSSTLPVAYKINPSGAPAGFAAAVRSSAAVWGTNSRIGFGFSYKGTTSIRGQSSRDGVHAVFWSSSGSGLSRGTLAATYTWRRGSRISGFDMVFNGRHRWGTDGSRWKTDIESVALHEFGHALGLLHSRDRRAVMTPSISAGRVARRLATDDINGAARLYPGSGLGGGTGPAPTPTPTPTRLSAPVLLSPKGSISDTTPSFSWRAVPGATRYELRIDVVGGSTGVVRRTDLTRTSMAPPGTFPLDVSFRWLVRAWSGSTAGSWGEATFVVVTETAPSGIASLTFPPDRRRISTTRPTFSWTAVRGATMYELAVVLNSGNRLVIHVGARGTSYTHSSRLPAGEIFTWYVRAHTGSSVGSWTAGSIFGTPFGG